MVNRPMATALIATAPIAIAPNAKAPNPCNMAPLDWSSRERKAPDPERNDSRARSCSIGSRFCCFIMSLPPLTIGVLPRTPQNQDLGGRSPPPPEGEGGHRNQIGQQPQNDLEFHNHGLMMRSALQQVVRATLAATDQLHTSTLRPGTFEKCLRLFVTTIIPWENACEAMRRSIFPIGLPERSNSERIRA